MKKLSVNLKIFVGFAIAIAGIGFFLSTTYRNAELSSRENKKSTYNLEIVSAAEKILDDMQDFETGYRGYLITGEEEYLEPAKSALKNYATDIASIKNLTGADKEKLAYVGKLEKLIDEKIKFGENIISLSKQNKVGDATSSLRSNKGKILMDGIRTHIAKLHNDSFKELRASNERRQIFADEMRNNFLALSLVILLVVFIFYLIIVIDIRKSERVKNDLRDASDRIRDLYENAPSGYMTLNAGLIVTQINKTALRWLGYSAHEVAGEKSLSELVSWQSVPLLNKFFEGDAVSNLEIELLGRNKTLPVLLDGIVKKDAQGNIIEKRVILTDISLRKKEKERSMYLAGLINQTSDAILSSDTDYKIRSWNKGAELMYGFTEEEILNQSTSLLRSDISEERRKEILDELETKGTWHGELMHHRKDGSPLYVLSSVTAIRDDQGKVTGYVSVVQDITTRKLYEDTLKNFNKELIEQVEEKTQQVNNIFERISDGFLSLDKDYRIIYLNSIAAKNLKGEKSNLLGQLLFNLLKGEGEDNSFRQAIRRSFETQKQVDLEDYHDYNKRWYFSSSYPSKEGVTVFFRDITSRKIAEIGLAENEKKYRLIFENNPLPMWVLDNETLTIADVNNSAIKHYGFSKEEFIGMNVLNLRPTEERERFLEFNEKRAPGQQNAGIWTHIKKDNTHIKVEIFSLNTTFNNRDCRLVISNDITEKLIYEEKLRETNEQLRELSIHMEKIREEERAHIAREIHDELGQQLTGLKMDISWLSRKIGTEPEGAREKITGMIQLVDETVRSVRKIASELRPGILDDLGLTAALGWQTHEFMKRTGIICNFVSEFKESTIDKNISIGVFRIYQEALTNVARHANATVVNALLSKNDKELKLEIHDNGAGMVPTNPEKKTLGLLGMKERAFMMNGNLSIDSSPGRGTRIQLLVPLEFLKLS